MVRKSTLTMACMLLTVGCTGLQTNNENDSKTRKNNNDLSANSNSDDRDDNIVIEIVGNNKKGNTGDSQSNNIEKKYGNHDKNNKSESDIEKVTERNSYTNENLDDLKITKLFDENSLVDRSMPNSQLVLQKLSELKRKQQEILKHGTVSQKKTVKLQNDLLKSYSHWKGTKYELGGDSATGIDCSALTRRVYREVFNKELPRVSTQQVKQGTRVSAKNLRSGDIVYFKPENRTSHTAVYVGNTLFINASSSKGVVMSSLKSPYWRKYFRYGVRVHNV